MSDLIRSSEGTENIGLRLKDCRNDRQEEFIKRPRSAFIYRCLFSLFCFEKWHMDFGNYILVIY